MIDFRKIALTDLVSNTGQIPGLPANPRAWTDSDIKRLAGVSSYRTRGDTSF